MIHDYVLNLNDGDFLKAQFLIIIGEIFIPNAIHMPFIVIHNKSNIKWGGQS